ncbi:MAG: hypothetical protein WKG00_38370 [Polyangiaceae bacterium]
MRRTLALCALAVLGTACADDTIHGAGNAGGGPPPGTPLWSRAFGRATALEDVVVAADAQGNVVVAGRFFATADFGGGPVTSPANNYQAFVAKYDAGGALVWLQTPGDIYEEGIDQVGVDDAGNVYVGGSFRGVMTLGAQTLLSLGQTTNPFVAKLSPAGEWLWARQVRGGYGTVYSMVVDGGGAVTLLGETSEGLDLGDGPLEISGPYLAKLDTAGAVQFAQPIKAENPAEYLYPAAIALDPSTGGTVRLGQVYGEFGGSTTEVVHVDGAGNAQWSRQLALGDNSAHTLAVGDDGTIYLAGWVYAPFDLGGGVAVPQPENGAAMVLALAPDGTPRWVRTFDAELPEVYDDGTTYDLGVVAAYALAAVPEGGLVVTGTYHGAVDFGGGLEVSGPWGGMDEYDTWSGGADDVFVLGLDASGDYRWHEVFGGPRAQSATSVAMVGGDRMVVAGSGQGALTPYYEGFAVGLRR